MNVNFLLGLMVALSCLGAPIEGPGETIAGDEERSPADMVLSVSGVPNDAPFGIEARATATHVTVEMALKPEWHVYCRDVGGGQPVSLKVGDDSDIVAVGAMQIPHSDDGKLTGTFQLKLPIGLGADVKSRQFDCTLKLQVCDALMCLPPMEISISGEVPSLRVLLVVGVENARTTRIEEWLSSRGLKFSTTTYANVKLSDCNSHDVVLADSNVFGKTTASRADVRQFPKTSTPLIAVGFNGTELVEAHEVAMTSGYI